MQRRRFLAAGLGTALLAPGAALARLPVYSGAALAFGTTIGISVRHADAALARRAIDAALAQARLVERLMSIYDSDSAVFRLNRDGVLLQPDAHLLRVLRHAQALSQLTGGAFDISVQPLWQASAHAAGMGQPLAAASRAAARALVDWRAIELGAARVAFARAGMRITLNGLAQGYAADLALAALRLHGVRHALVDSGEFAASGDAGGRSWQLGVPDPRAPQRMLAALRCDGRCVATSGDYASAFSADFLHHHIFDPASGDSPLELASVTVVAPRAIDADGLSTACMVLGTRAAHALVARLPAVDVLTIDKGGRLQRSPGFPAAG